MHIRKTWKTYDHYAFGGVAILGTVFAIILIEAVMMTPRWAAWEAELGQVSGPFMNVLGVLFGLTLAFLANDTWTAHDRARGAVLREADAIRRLDILAETTPPETRPALHAAIRAYAAAAVDEWPALAHCETSGAAAVAADDLLRHVAFDRAGGGAGGPVRQAMINAVTEVRENRDVRIGLSRTHVNPLKWLGMAFLGFLTLLSIAAIHATDPAAALVAMILFGLAAAPTAAIVLVHGNPFQQPSAVTPAHLQAALAGTTSQSENG